MSRSSAPSSPSGKIELETVVNWPLLVSAATLACIVLVVPLVLAGLAAWKGGAVKDPVATRPTMPEPQPVKISPTATPARPTIDRVKPAEAATPLQIYVEASRPHLKPSPIPVVVAAPRPPRVLDPILQVPGLPEPPPFNRLDSLSEDLLLSQLLRSTPEVDLEHVKGTRDKLLAQARAAAKEGEKTSAILALYTERADLKGLPVLGEEVCQTRPEAAKKMQEISQKLRRVLDRAPLGRNRYPGPKIEPLLENHKDWLKDDGLSTVVQMLQAGDLDMRRELVERLDNVKSTKATLFLARAAVYDLSPLIRQQAVLALIGRPRREYEQVLLDGLRYPWPPVAAHAAEALVKLKDREALPHLATLLAEEDPCAPRLDLGNKWVVSEVVRVNHLRNCLLCHAPSTAKTDLLRGFVPKSGEPLPPAYYGSPTGDFVRADVTYLRQDFSVMQQVAKPDRWPRLQRFDYLVRTRELTADETAVWKEKAKESAASDYPQREAVLFALRELTGQNAGARSSDWYDLLYTLELSGEQ